jgi:hypothetical protein
MPRYRQNPMSNADLLFTIEGLPGYWTEFSGIKEQYVRPKYTDPTSARQLSGATGAITVEPVTIAKPYDPELPEDEAILAWADAQKCAKLPFNFTVTPVYRCNGIAKRGEKSWTLIEAKITSFSIFENADIGNGQEIAKIKLMFEYNSFTHR